MGRICVSVERKRLRINLASSPSFGSASSPAATAWKYPRPLLSDGVSYVLRSTCVRGSGRVEFSAYSGGRGVVQTVLTCDLRLLANGHNVCDGVLTDTL